MQTSWALSKEKDLQVNSGTFVGMPLKRRNEVLYFSWRAEGLEKSLQRR